ncbi:hypothetical protein GCK32_015305 [Trichostrongylus colubriformis]|uniref:Uncharacterized protein n=1 Tax=Trichostrongylus colubriformis TaxID=6319 RepID=A0AAN8FMY4_TRICO
MSAEYLSYEDRRFPHPLNILYRMLTASRTVVPDILIGIDYFCDIYAADHPQMLPSGLVLCHTHSVPPSVEEEIDPISRFDHFDVIGITDDLDPSVDREEEARILQRFKDTVQEVDGYLYVQFPWKTPDSAHLGCQKKLFSRFDSSSAKGMPHISSGWRTPNYHLRVKT